MRWRAADTGAIHQHARELPCEPFGFRDRRLDRFLVGDVGMQGDALDFRRDFSRIFLILVDYADLGAFGGHGARGGGAEAGATAGDENGRLSTAW